MQQMLLIYLGMMHSVLQVCITYTVVFMLKLGWLAGSPSDWSFLLLIRND